MERIAQLVIVPVVQAAFRVVDGGFGRVGTAGRGISVDGKL
jgi:dUTPase